MTDVSATLEGLAAGTVGLDVALENLRAALERQGADQQAIASLIETGYLADKIPGQAYLALMDVVRAASPRPASAAQQDTDRTRLRRPDDESRTRLRQAPRSPSEREPEPSPEPDETRFRPVQRDVPQTARPAPGTTDRSAPQLSGPTGASWGDPSQWEHTHALQPGDVVKERFVLEEIIGQGGMGVVFKARDMRKEEAQDRHPYVALKVLNEDFKRHPESLKALQREARKAQNLAHPNIVTVYDFDRDGSNVYIVMELLEGEPLDGFIRSLNGSGLTIARALPIIRSLCGALSYAHQHKVVHSDFKPANAYFTRGGAIKVFDFGIARAAKFKGDAEAAGKGDTSSALTLFDAATLGALTPAYASCEMIEGLDPDPRDDVYALGCVAYELLTGSHPFQRKSAVHARDAKLKPRPVRGLTGRQWRALRRALAFDREQRSPSADAFLEEISPQRRSPAVWAGAAALALVAIGAALLLPRYLQTRQVDALTARVMSGSSNEMETVLPQLLALPDTVRAGMLLDERVRVALIDHFRAVIAASFDVEQQRYAYPQAAQRLAQLRQLLPDSQAVAEIGMELEDSKNDEITRQSDALDESLQRGWLVDGQNPVNVRSVLATVAQIDPQHALLRDPRLPSAYAEAAQSALGSRDIDLAQSLASAGLEVAAQDPTLQDLNDRIEREAAEQQRVERLAQLRRRLETDLPAADSLSQLDEVHEDLRLLQAVAPADSGLRRVQARLQQLLNAEIAALTAAGSLHQAQALLARYADISPPQYVAAQRTTLLGLYVSRGISTAERDAAMTAVRQELDASLASPARDDAWNARVQAQLTSLSAYLPDDDAYVGGARSRAAEVHLQVADALREQGRLSEAERSLALAAGYAPDLPQIAAERGLLATLRAEQEARDLEQKRVAEVSARRQKFQDQISADDVAAAAESLRVLRGSLPAEDPFLQSAPGSLADAYLRLAEAATRTNRFDVADRMLSSAMGLAPGNARIVAVRADLARQRTATGIGPETPQVPTVAGSAPAGAAPGQAATSTARVSPAVVTPAIATPQPVAPPVTATSTPAGVCSPSLAGHGRRSRGICYDAVPGGRGPELVVVPSGPGFATPFAISRTEISGADYALYCGKTAGCTSSVEANLPVTGIAVADAQRYAQWLSSNTGFTYRLPSDAEWTYVANAPGSSTERDYNCVVELNGQKIRGFSLVGVREGLSNGWGLHNLLGNAREWVRSGQGWSVRGGAWNDPISRCEIGSATASNGAADDVTGFRLVREVP